MVDVERLAAFVAMAFVIIVIPGPSVLFVIGRALSYGRRIALITVAGNTAGAYLALALVALGVGSVVERRTRHRSDAARSPRRLAAVGGTGGLAMIGLGVTVALTGRKD